MLKLQNVSKYYHSNDTVALGLRKVSLEFNLGEFVAVTGESGSGKSTLLNVISGLDTYEDGELYVNGEETSYYSIAEWEAYRRQYIGFVFQNYNIIDSYSVLENVMVALTIQGYDKDLRKERALELIDRVGLSTHIHHKASKLSGGQKQRAVIARALAKDCPIIVADEPTGNLDSESGKKVLELLHEISKDKLVIVVTHNYSEIEDYATRKIRLFDGEVVEDKTLEAVNKVEDDTSIPSYHMGIWNLITMSIRNLYRTPRRTIFTLIVMLFVVLIFTFSYGSYVSSTNSNGSGYNAYFSNVTASRIIVTKFDETSFTNQEISELENLSRTRYVLEHDVLLDSVILDYYTQYDWISSNNSYINPAGMLRKSDLSSGRLPTNEFEIVIEERNDYSVGDTIDLGYNYPYYDSNSDQLPETTEFKIVGEVRPVASNRYIKNIYFHEDYITKSDVIAQGYLGNVYSQAPVELMLGVPMDEDMQRIQLWQPRITLDNTILDNEVVLSEQYIQEIAWMKDIDFDPDNPFYDGETYTIFLSSNFFSEERDITISGITTVDEEKEFGLIKMNQDTYDSLMDFQRYQVSVLVQDAYDAERVIDDIKDLGYTAIYPAGVTDYFSEAIRILQSIGMGILLTFLLLVMYFISYAILRNIQDSKKKDYIIFRSIGASKKDLNKVTIIELVFSVLFAFILGVIILYVNTAFNSPVPNYLRFFDVGNYVFLLILLFALALLLGNRFNKRIFSKSVITSLKGE